jgi:hypothetical protein
MAQLWSFFIDSPRLCQTLPDSAIRLAASITLEQFYLFAAISRCSTLYLTTHSSQVSW